MTMRRSLVGAAVLALSLVWGSSAAFAFCGTVSASATAANQGQAMAKANSIGVRETNQLDANYGNKVKYQPAKVACSLTNSNKVKCQITQKFCVNESKKTQQVFSGEVDPNTASCKSLQRKCNAGNNTACGNYENQCQND